MINTLDALDHAGKNRAELNCNKEFNSLDWKWLQSRINLAPIFIYRRCWPDNSANCPPKIYCPKINLKTKKMEPIIFQQLFKKKSVWILQIILINQLFTIGKKIMAINFGLDWSNPTAKIAFNLLCTRNCYIIDLYSLIQAQSQSQIVFNSAFIKQLPDRQYFQMYSIQFVLLAH